MKLNLYCAYFDMKIQGVSQNLIKFLYARIKSSFHVKDFNEVFIYNIIYKFSFNYSARDL